MDKSIYLKAPEEFGAYNGLDHYLSSDLEIKEKLKAILVSNLKKYNDPMYGQYMRQLIPML